MVIGKDIDDDPPTGINVVVRTADIQESTYISCTCPNPWDGKGIGEAVEEGICTLDDLGGVVWVGERWKKTSIYAPRPENRNELNIRGNSDSVSDKWAPNSVSERTPEVINSISKAIPLDGCRVLSWGTIGSQVIDDFLRVAVYGERPVYVGSVAKTWLTED